MENSNRWASGPVHTTPSTSVTYIVVFYPSSVVLGFPNEEAKASDEANVDLFEHFKSGYEIFLEFHKTFYTYFLYQIFS